MDFSRFNSIGLKIILVIILVLLFLIPLVMIDDLADERQKYRKTVESELLQSWGSEQNIGSILVGVPVLVKEVDQKNSWKTLYFSPEDLDIKGEAVTELRKRGIYKVPIFHSTFNIKGTFIKPDIKSEISANIQKVEWDQAFAILSLSDSSGLKAIPDLVWNGRSQAFKSSTLDSGLGDGHLAVPISLRSENSFSMKIDIRGSKKIEFYPLARRINIDLKSNWPDPKFYGSTLPESHNIEKQGFEAKWSQLNLVPTMPRMWLSEGYQYQDISPHAFGIELIVPVDFYQRVVRALKYGFLFTLIPFLIIFFMEVLTGIRVHFVQYIIVGLTNVVFYLLLLSLSEHIGFLGSYIVSSVAITGLLYFYLESVLKDRKRALIFLPIQVILYTLMYVMLNSTDFALLIGSIGVFVILAAIMLVTRKVDWYKIKKKSDDTSLS